MAWRLLSRALACALAASSCSRSTTTTSAPSNEAEAPRERPSPPPAPTSVAPTATAPSGRGDAAALSFLHLTTGGSDRGESLPWVVAFHGLGDKPESFAGLFEQLEVKAHVFIPRAPIAYGSGYDWFGVRVMGEPDKLAEAISGRLPAVKQLLESLAARDSTQGDGIVTGFSQGGVMSLAVANAGLAYVRAVLPIAGALPETLARQEPPAIPVYAFHGEADRVVPFEQTRLLFDQWLGARDRSGGSPLPELRTYPSLGHSIDAQLWKDWAIRLTQLLSATD